MRPQGLRCHDLDIPGLEMVSSVVADFNSINESPRFEMPRLRYTWLGYGKCALWPISILSMRPHGLRCHDLDIPGLEMVSSVVADFHSINETPRFEMP